MRKEKPLKSYNGLYDRMMDKAEMKLSVKEAAKKRKERSYVKRTLNNIDAYIDDLHDEIDDGLWEPEEHEETILQEGFHRKKRNIVKPRWDSEQIVHHMLMRQFIPIIQPKLYKYSCGSIKGRGVHYLLKAAKSWISGYGGKKLYIAELDIRKFYDNVDVSILKGNISRLIRDKRYNEIMFKVIGNKKKGICKGFYTSPWLAHLYLMKMDSFITQQLRPDHYCRYVDNLWLFHRNKKELRKMVNQLSDFINRELKLEFNDSWQIYKFETFTKFVPGVKRKLKGRAINLAGFVVHRNRVGIRKGILERIRAKANRMNRLHRCTIKDARSMVSRMGYFKHSNSHNYYLIWIKPKVSIRYCKRRIKYYKGGKQNDRLERGARRSCAGAAGYGIQPQHCV